MSDKVLIKEQDGMMAITLNRPEALNALDPETMDLLQAAWSRLAQESELRVAVITGTGDRAFSAGADLKAGINQSRAAIADLVEEEVARFLPPLGLRKPVIAAINGLAVGGGFELALACDIIVAVDSARFALTEVKIGSLPGAGGTQRIIRKLPVGIAKRLLLTGEWLSVEKALHYGLVSEVVPREGLMEAAFKVADAVKKNAPLSIAAAKLAADWGSDLSLADGLRVERTLFGLLRDTEDRREGRKAFAEKRPAEWTGR